MKAKAEAMRGWWVEKGTNRMEVKGVHRISGKWYVRGYAPKAKTRRCAPSTRMVWWKVKACSRQGDNTVEKREVSRRIVEQQQKELASQDYWMDDENLELRSEWMWRRHVDREEAMVHVYSDGSVKYATLREGGRDVGVGGTHSGAARQTKQHGTAPSGGGRWKRDKSTGSNGESDTIG